jgi:hypothetical protein
MTALLWISMTAGFWPSGAWQIVPYIDRPTCEAARPRVELELQARGMQSIVTRCIEINERHDG